MASRWPLNASAACLCPGPALGSVSSPCSQPLVPLLIPHGHVPSTPAFSLGTRRNHRHLSAGGRHGGADLGLSSGGPPTCVGSGIMWVVVEIADARASLPGTLVQGLGRT